MLDNIEQTGLAADTPHRTLCTNCGVSRTKAPERCGRACQFIKPDYPTHEHEVHGRVRDQTLDSDEAWFGVFERMHRAAMKQPRDGAQWTGITTEIARRLLEAKKVDAVLTVAPDADDRWKPVPVIVTDPAELDNCRGMRMGYAPTIALVEPAIEAGHTRLAVIAIPCQVYALRALEKELGLEELFVIGTPCSDNTTTANFHRFLKLLSDEPDQITYLEFRADYHVELRFEDGAKKLIPFLKLPISKLPGDFFPLTCQTCVDYTNSLSDITVGYMAGEGEQWLIVRNRRGQAMLDLLGDDVSLAEPRSKGNRTKPVKGFMANVRRSANGLPVRAMPDFLRPVMAKLMPLFGPKGLEFARTRVEMKAIETVLHLERKAPSKMKNMIPDHVWILAKQYGLGQRNGE